MSSSIAVAPAPASSAPRSIIYLGLDVHKDSITVAVLPATAKTPTRLERLPNDLAKLKRWLARVAQGGALRACSEASGAGYVLHRAMQEWGYTCEVIAPSLIPKRSGVQRKHDKHDATELARLDRAGELTTVRIPRESDERVRDVVRCRATFQREILKSRHYILKFLARRGFVFREGTHWCTPHLKWLQHLTTDGSALAPHDRLVFREYHALLLYKLQRRLGSITKAGNSHCRHVLVQAAWSYHHRPQTSVDLKRRQQGQPPSVIAHAGKAQQRLHQRFTHLASRKRPPIAAVAVARELVGFLWAVMQELPAVHEVA